VDGKVPHGDRLGSASSAGDERAVLAPLVRIAAVEDGERTHLHRRVDELGAELGVHLDRERGEDRDQQRDS